MPHLLTQPSLRLALEVLAAYLAWAILVAAHYYTSPDIFLYKAIILIIVDPLINITPFADTSSDGDNIEYKSDLLFLVLQQFSTVLVGKEKTL